MPTAVTRTGAQIADLIGCALLPTLGVIAPRAPAPIAVDGARTVALGGGEVRYHDAGDGDAAIVFLHGFNSQLAIWDPVFARMAGGPRRIRIDLPGYGGSTWRSDTYDLPSQGARVIELLDALGVARATLVGVSMGASLAAWIAARAPARVAGLVLLAPSGYPGALRYRGPFGHVLRPGAPRSLATRIARSAPYRRRYPDSRALHALTVVASYGTPWATALADLRVHAWVVWSRGDRTVPFAYAGAVCRATPASTLIPLPAEVGHDVPRRRPALIAELARAVHDGARPDRITRALAPRGES